MLQNFKILTTCPFKKQFVDSGPRPCLKPTVFRSLVPQAELALAHQGTSWCSLGRAKVIASKSACHLVPHPHLPCLTPSYFFHFDVPHPWPTSPPTPYIPYSPLPRPVSTTFSAVELKLTLEFGQSGRRSKEGREWRCDIYSPSYFPARSCGFAAFLHRSTQSRLLSPFHSVTSIDSGTIPSPCPLGADGFLLV